MVGRPFNRSNMCTGFQAKRSSDEPTGRPLFESTVLLFSWLQIFGGSTFFMCVSSTVRTVSQLFCVGNLQAIQFDLIFIKLFTFSSDSPYMNNALFALFLSILTIISFK